MKIKYEADDGKVFDTADECRAHEEMLAFAPLIGLDEARLALAMQRHPDAIDISDALEKAGARIAKQRREAGDLRRERRAKGDAETAGGAGQGGDDEPTEGPGDPTMAERETAALAAAVAYAEDRTEGMPF